MGGGLGLLFLLGGLSLLLRGVLGLVWLVVLDFLVSGLVLLLVGLVGWLLFNSGLLLGCLLLRLLGGLLDLGSLLGLFYDGLLLGLGGLLLLCLSLFSLLGGFLLGVGG